MSDIANTWNTLTDELRRRRGRFDLNYRDYEAHSDETDPNGLVPETQEYDDNDPYDWEDRYDDGYYDYDGGGYFDDSYDDEYSDGAII